MMPFFGMTLAKSTQLSVGCCTLLFALAKRLHPTNDDERESIDRAREHYTSTAGTTDAVGAAIVEEHGLNDATIDCRNYWRGDR